MAFFEPGPGCRIPHRSLPVWNTQLLRSECLHRFRAAFVANAQVVAKLPRPCLRQRWRLLSGFPVSARNFRSFRSGKWPRTHLLPRNPVAMTQTTQPQSAQDWELVDMTNPDSAVTSVPAVRPTVLPHTCRAADRHVSSGGRLYPCLIAGVNRQTAGV